MCEKSESSAVMPECSVVVQGPQSSFESGVPIAAIGVCAEIGWARSMRVCSDSCLSILALKRQYRSHVLMGSARVLTVI